MASHHKRRLSVVLSEPELNQLLKILGHYSLTMQAIGEHHKVVGARRSMRDKVLAAIASAEVADEPRRHRRHPTQ